MSGPNFRTSFTVSQSPAVVFAAINDVRGWWTGDPGIKGATDKLGAVFTYQYGDLHFTKQKITEFIPGKRVAWLVQESRLSFVKDEKEWDGTSITFDIAKKGNKTEVRFSHVGLVPEFECYGDCSSAWGYYVKGPLVKLIKKNGAPARSPAKAKAKPARRAGPTRSRSKK
jgi:hypothetical protein